MRHLTNPEYPSFLLCRTLSIGGDHETKLLEFCRCSGDMHDDFGGPTFEVQRMIPSLNVLKKLYFLEGFYTNQKGGGFKDSVLNHSMGLTP